jgi:hypothetical protein
MLIIKYFDYIYQKLCKNKFVKVQLSLEIIFLQQIRMMKNPFCLYKLLLMQIIRSKTTKFFYHVNTSMNDDQYYFSWDIPLNFAALCVICAETAALVNCACTVSWVYEVGVSADVDVEAGDVRPARSPHQHRHQHAQILRDPYC